MSLAVPENHIIATNKIKEINHLHIFGSVDRLSRLRSSSTTFRMSENIPN